MDRIEIALPWDALTKAGGGGGPRKPAHLFVAYRFNDPESRALRNAIAAAVKKEPSLIDTDGHVKEGESWATEVRKRIKKSRLVVADLTGPSREVLFEVGFAGNKVIFPVCLDAAQLEALPSCLTMHQIRLFANEELPFAVDRIIDRALGPLPNSRRPPPVPGQIAWVQGKDSAWADEGRHRVEDLVSAAGLTFVRLSPDDLYSFEDLTDQLRCWLIFGCIDGGAADYVGHLFFGDVAAREKAGAGRGKREFLRRHGIAFCRSEEAREKFLADSAKRLRRELLTIVEDDAGLVAGADKHLKRHTAWLRDHR